MRNSDQVIELIKEREKDIVENINDESIAVYNFLKKEFNRGDVTTNYLFQFVYRSFYRLDNAGLTDEFKREYFKIMQEIRNSENIDPQKIQEILILLYDFKRRKGDHSIQFSFTTKMINTVNDNYPIYDSQLLKFLNFQPIAFLI